MQACVSKVGPPLDKLKPRPGHEHPYWDEIDAFFFPQVVEMPMGLD